MANIKSSKKDIKRTATRRKLNMSRQSDIRTSCKKVEAALEEKKIDLAKSLLIEAQSKIARAKGKGLLKQNTASNKISRLAKKVSLAAKA